MQVSCLSVSVSVSPCVRVCMPCHGICMCMNSMERCAHAGITDVSLCACMQSSKGIVRDRDRDACLCMCMNSMERCAHAGIISPSVFTFT
jgi:hypothetical protein